MIRKVTSTIGSIINNQQPPHASANPISGNTIVVPGLLNSSIYVNKI